MSLLTPCNKLAEQLVTMPTKALVRTRQAMQAGRTNTLEQQLTLEGLYARELGRSSDYVEGVSAFLEKRTLRALRVHESALRPMHRPAADPTCC